MIRRSVHLLAGLLFLGVYDRDGSSADSHIGHTLSGFTLDGDLDARVIPLFADASADAALLVVETGEDDERFLSRYSSVGREWVRDYRVPLDPQMQLFDIARVGDQSYFVGYSDQRLHYLDPKAGQFRPLLAISSMYRGRVENELFDIGLVKDLNGDGRDDVMIPDFDGWQVSVQRADASFTTPTLLGPPPSMGMGSERYVYFRAQEPYLLDHDLDGRRDLAFWVDGKFSVHHQSGDGNYLTQDVALDTGIDDVREGLFAIGIGEDADNLSGRNSMIGAVHDLNGDGFDDLIIYTLEGDGIFGMKTQYEIHLGSRGSDHALQFEQQPSSVVASGGIQIDNQRLDLDGDGTLDIIVTSVDFGLGTILRALFARTVSLRLSIYRMANGVYPSEPNVARRITATVNLSEGEIFVPAVVAADVNGDGLKDLLVQDGLDELRIFLGTGDANLFTDESQRIALALPDDREQIQVADLDRDGRDDLILLIDADGERRVTTVRFHD